MAYYPDGQQERILSSNAEVVSSVDLFHMMSYDQHGKHSTWEFGKKSVDQGLQYFPSHKLTMGLPFYARSISTGQWKTYEEIMQRRPGLEANKNEVKEKGERWYFNGKNMIARKTKYAMRKDLGGVMVWELGQDAPPDLQPANSLLVTIHNTIEAGEVREEKEDREL